MWILVFALAICCATAVLAEGKIDITAPKTVTVGETVELTYTNTGSVAVSGGLNLQDVDMLSCSLTSCSVNEVALGSR